MTQSCMGYNPCLGWTPPRVAAGTPANGWMGIDLPNNKEQLGPSLWMNQHAWGHLINWGLYGINWQTGEHIESVALAAYCMAAAAVIYTRAKNNPTNNATDNH